MTAVRASVMVFAISLLAASFTGSGQTYATGSTTRVSVSDTGAEGNASSSQTSISADGRYVAFRSDATNLVPNDTNGASDVFVHDRQTGGVERANVDSAGAQANGSSFPSGLGAWISDDGRFVLFPSSASNLVAGDTNGVDDVFARDRLTGTTERVSVDSAGGEGNSVSSTGSISADARFVVFRSLASNLDPGDSNGAEDLFVRDRQAGSTSRIAVGGRSTDPVISADGRYVAYACCLFTPELEIFVHDRTAGQTTQVTSGNGSSNGPALSHDGRYLAFYSDASDLVAGDTNGRLDVFLYDRQAGTTGLLSKTASGVQGNDASSAPRLSADGRWVAFRSLSSNLGPGDFAYTRDIFRLDRQTGAVLQLTHTSPFPPPQPGDTQGPDISDDGSIVAFYSTDCGHVPDDTNSTFDIFVHDVNGTPPSPGGDPDSDGFAWTCDNCPDDPNAGQQDADGDGPGDLCDNCPNSPNAGQEDADNDGIGDPCDSVWSGIDALSVDAEDDATPGNSGTFVGSVESCRRINANGALDADEDDVDTIALDVVVAPAGIPAPRPMTAFSFTLNYSSMRLGVAASNVYRLLAVRAGSSVTNGSDSIPDSDGAFHVTATDTSGTTGETGVGVLATVYLQAVSAVPSVVPLTLSDYAVIGPGGIPVPPATVNDAAIAVNAMCSDLDGDSDTVIDAADNCPIVPNAAQTNTDGDSDGDACDPDDDNDSASDLWETGCGTDSLNASHFTPERTDGAFAGVDDDSDGAADEPLPPGAEAFDCDGDGYKGSVEAGTPLCGNTVSGNTVNDDGVVFGGSDDATVDDGCPGGPPAEGAYSEAQFNIGTSDQDPCGGNGWPSELLSGGITDNKVTLQDVTSFVAPAPRKYQTNPGAPGFNPRWDLVPGRSGATTWIALNDILSLVAGPGGRPPMLGGAKAFNGPVCPWPP